VVYVYFYSEAGEVFKVDEYTADSGAIENDFEGDIFIEGIGAGGSGAGLAGAGDGGGGAGGQYANVTETVSAGQFINVFVPGAKIGTNGNGAQGGDAIVDIDATEVLRAKGGAGGTAAAGGIGSVTGGVGDVVYKGGDGAAPDAIYSGAGGGAAGEDGNGVSAVNPNGGNGNGADSGKGGNSHEVASDNFDGFPGENYGGGGGGATALDTAVLGGDGAQGLVKISYLAPTAGFYRYKTTADALKTITSGAKTKTVSPVDTCDGDLLIKYMDKNGQFRFFPFSKYYETRDFPEKIGSSNKLLIDILSDQTDKLNIGYRNTRRIEATAEADDAQLEKLSDLYTSPRVYLKVGSGDNTEDWIIVEVQASEAIVRRRRPTSGTVGITITLPKHYTITML
jgi:hypothetical protein